MVTDYERHDWEIETNRLRSFQDGIPNLAWTADPNGAIDYVNRRWVEYTGRPPDQLVDDRWHSVVHPEDLLRHIDRWRHAMRTGEPYDENLRIRRHDGVYRWHSVRDWPERDATGKIVHWYGTAVDVDDQRRWADAKNYSEERLRAANQELKEFASIAAHDLKEPLRMVTGFLSLLKRQTLKKLDMKEQDWVIEAIDGAERMQRMINELLDFARVDTGEMCMAPVDCSEVLDTALANLMDAVKESAASIDKGDMPVVLGSKEQLTRLFQNLLSNAMKYHRQGVPPVIAIHSVRHGNEWFICVQDNGIGIAESDRERIFDIYKRLHTRGDFPGTGLGLSICKKIAERHHGRIWVTSTPGSGSAFNVNLPAAD
jgi:PAS domain S-box-containing protein